MTRDAISGKSDIERAGRESLLPSLSVAVKLASIAVHIEEMLSSDGHAFDRTAIETLLADAEVKAYLDTLASKALLPVKR